MKIAFMFPGQGAQYVGMGRDFYENYPEAGAVFDMAGQAAGFDVRRVCFEENDDINRTEYTQAAMLATECAILEVVQNMGIKADTALGLSLGEYGALVAADVLNAYDAISIVRQRGILMEQAVPAGQGTMSAVLGADSELVENVLAECSGTVTIANYNCPGQLVISGETYAVRAASEALKSAGIKRVVELNVSGPFHSPLLEQAGEKLGSVLDNYTFNRPAIPYVANVTADYVTDEPQVKELLMKQVSSSVRFEQSVRRLIGDGTDTFIEIGPGHTLSSFVKKTDRSVNIINIEKTEDLKKLEVLNA